MYQPPQFMTVDVLEGVLSQYKWPAPYTLEDNLPAGILVTFPRCEVSFREGFESDMDVVFLSVDSEFDYSVTLTEVVLALRDQGLLPAVASQRPGKFFTSASLERVQSELRELCELLHTTFRPTLEGDFRWVDAVKRFRAKGKNG